jgi:hypothetical protein
MFSTEDMQEALLRLDEFLDDPPKRKRKQIKWVVVAYRIMMAFFAHIGFPFAAAFVALAILDRLGETTSPLLFVIVAAAIGGPGFWVLWRLAFWPLISWAWRDHFIPWAQKVSEEE